MWPYAAQEVCICCFGTGRVDPLRNGLLLSMRNRPPSSSTFKHLFCSAVNPNDMTSIGRASNLIVIELGCSQRSAINRASALVGLNYIGIHDRMASSCKALCSEAIRMICELRQRASSGKRDALEALVHISFPCKGGSPLQHFNEGHHVLEHTQRYLEMLDATQVLLREVKKAGVRVLCTLELLASSRYWKNADIQEWLRKNELNFHGNVFGCSMGLVSRFGNPVGKKFRLASTDEEFVKRLERRFICRCAEIEHAPFYEVDYTATQLYTKRFAFFFVRSWIRGLKETGKSPASS